MLRRHGAIYVWLLLIIFIYFYDSHSGSSSTADYKFCYRFLVIFF